MTLPDPEPADGAVTLPPPFAPEPALVELPALELPPELELPPVPELPDVLPDEPELPVLVALDPELAGDAWCVPGSANATAPAAAMLTAPAVAVTVRSLACPRSRSATARLVTCECLLIGCILLAWFMSNPRRQAWGAPLACL